MGWFTRDRPQTIADYPSRPSRAQRREQRAAEREQAAAARRRRNHHRHATAADHAGQAWEARDRANDDRGGWYRPSR